MGKSRIKLLSENIKNDLLDQLARNGTAGTQYTNMIDDYMELWGIKNSLLADIKERGVTIDVYLSGGNRNQKKNESVDQLVKINAQMLKILSELGIKPVQEGGGLDDEM